MQTIAITFQQRLIAAIRRLNRVKPLGSFVPMVRRS
jgi:hypothetical protein